MGEKSYETFLSLVRFNESGLVPVIVQDCETGEVLTLAYMNKDAIMQTLKSGKAWYWRRSHGRLMMKGERSGRVQIVKEVRFDCDADALLIKVEQVGGAACHEGYRSCFFRRLREDGTIEVCSERLFDPKEVYSG
ncbi:MAG: phosphoribosyl-AMP cyclohydrolase [Armatimonadota bacterium]|nr:phosphoribosyl-AMP cyclohydrolase [Armatimonadota bacterium]MCX7777497.1 phosphoribosyl-AMP cyclohydrolase [Armatimonadota bacterium]MDW8025973.1 phosphoribosyl-AMP cyclohydrolase [Armatimonadota bacterium]